MIWIIIISLLLAFLLWLLFGPLILLLNTETNRYYVTLPGIFKAAMVPTPELFHIRGWIFFVPFKYHPFSPRKDKKKEKPPRPKKKKRRRKLSGSTRMIAGAIRSVRIRRFHLDIDTDDFILNAWLVPVFSSVNSENIRLRVNFEGSSSLLLDLRIRLGALLWVVIRNKYKSIINL